MRPTTYLVLATCLTAALPLLGCGGAGGIVDEFLAPDTASVSVLSERTLDGRVSSSGHIDLAGDVWRAYTGDRGADVSPSYRCRQLYAFDLGDVPSGARIVRATLRLYQARVEGEPYEDIGNVVVDHVEYVDDPGLQSYDGQTLARNIGTISSSPDLGSKTLDVTHQVAGNVETGDAWSQFRIRFNPTGIFVVDHENDFANFTDAENDDFIAVDPPYLDIVYER